MNITDIGEDGLVQLIKERFLPPPGLIGIGDDCASIPGSLTGDECWLVTTDALVEGVHFLSTTLSPKDLGYKSAIVNISDIASKGGDPLYAFLSIALPKTVEAKFLVEFLEGLESAFKEYKVSLLGGDTTASLQGIFINITLIGRGKPKYFKRRSEGKPGDVIVVNNSLGDSLSGFKLLSSETKAFQTKYPQLIKAHQRPKAYIEEGKWLSQQLGVHAMMDLSDGLSTDLQRLIKASNCGAEVKIEQLPLSLELQNFAKDKNLDPQQIALEGGEEYCLLFTVSSNSFEKLQKDYYSKFGHSFYPLGFLTEQANELKYTFNGIPQQITVQPFQHFNKNP